MPRKATGTIWRSEDRAVLKMRITVVDNAGRKHRPWLELDPAFDDDTARRIAAEVSKEARGKPWDPSRFSRHRRVGPVVTCDEYFEKLWAPSRVGKVKSLRSDRYRYRLHIGPLIGTKAMTDVTPDDLRDVVEALDKKADRNADRRDKHRFGKKNACNCWAIVTKMFDDAVNSKERELRILEKNPTEGVRPPEPPKAVEKQWLFPKELRQLLSCRAVPLYRRRLYAAAVYCYTRPGETLALLWGRSIDLKHGMVRVNRAYDSVEDRENEYTKSEDSRHFAIEPILRPMFEAMWKEKPKQGLIFPTLDKLSEMLRADMMVAEVRRAALHVRRKGALLIRFHDLRATGITYMAMRGDSDHDVRERAGHSDFKTTQIYIRRGHLVARDVGDPWEPLPECLLGESSQESSGGSGFKNGSASTSEELERSGRRDLKSQGAQGVGALPKETQGKSGAETEATPALGTLQDDSGTIPDDLVVVNAARHRRLEMVAEAGRDRRPGLAICRGLDAAYHGDEPATVKALAEAAEALGLSIATGGAGR